MTTSNNLATSINRFWLTREWTHGSKTHRQFYDAHTGFKNVDQSYVEYWAKEQGILINDITNKGKLQETPRPMWIPNMPQVTKVDMYFVENHWRPSDVIPNDLDLESALDAAAPFVDFMKLGFGENNWQWVVNWLSYRYQVPKPDKKPHSALYIFSTIHGTGKSTLASIIEEVFGRNNVKRVSGGESVTAKGSVANWSRALLIAEEVSPQLGSNLYQTIKSYTGQDSVEQDAKFKDYSTWEIPAQLVMISNHAPTFFEPSDRRFAVFNLDKLDGWIKANGFYEWLNSGGYAAIATVLKSWPVEERLAWVVPMTPEKEEALHMSSLDLVVEKIKDVLANNPEKVFFEAHELLGQDRDSNLGSQLKHKAKAAGVKPIGQQRFRGGKASLWVREEVTEPVWKAALLKVPKIVEL